MAGIIYTDRKLGAEVRSLTLKKIKAVLEDDKNEIYKKDFQEALILRLAGSVLPRLNEVTGEDGKPIIFQVSKEIAEKNNINETDNSTSEPKADSTRQA